MIVNLPEGFLYERLPDAVIDLDERGIIAAVVGGIQDRLDDLRSYGRNLQFLFDPASLPDAENNVVLVDLLTEQGVSFTRSLDFQDDTPADGTVALVNWAAAQLKLEVSEVANVRYGRDLMRSVDANTLSYLAETLGAILYNTDITTASDAQRIVTTYFPRLKIKGTGKSFETLGRVLGFDDVVFTPLWGRVSPRVPSDPGNAANDPDFAPLPEYWPQQELGPFYDPLTMRDGPFYTWSGTVSNGTGSTSFYSQVINGFSPFIDVVVLNVEFGTVTHPVDGSYALDNGAPHARAYVDPADAGVRFRALGEGSTWNGLLVNVTSAGTDKLISVTDRLSALKYRTSYFDLALVADIDTAGDVFGERSAQPNKDLIANPSLDPDGTAVTPYRPWIKGSITTGTVYSDWLTKTGANAPVVVTSRQEAAGTNSELAFDRIMTAGVQVAQAMEEVRPATRFARKTSTGLLINEDVPYACYVSDATLAVTSGTKSVYSGSHPRTILPDYIAEITLRLPATFAMVFHTDVGVEYQVRSTSDFVNYGTVATLIAESGTTTYYIALTGTAAFFIPFNVAAGTVPFNTFFFANNLALKAWDEVNPSNPDIGYYRYVDAQVTNLEFAGSYNFSTGSYYFDFMLGAPPLTRVDVHWTATDTEVIRDEPTYQEKHAGDTTCQARPEDEEGPTSDEVVDDYPWRRAVVGGGDLMDADIYAVENGAVIVDEVDDTTAVPDQSGVEHSVYAVNSATGHGRLTTQLRPTDNRYQPGQVAIGYSGTFRDLMDYSAAERGLANTETDLETQFLPGFAIYHVGLVQGVLVADPTKFFGPHHRTGLVGWLPFNEHAEDDLTVADRAEFTTRLYASGLRPGDRVWDADKGWCLSVSGALTFYSNREIADEATMSLWIKPGAAGTGTTTIARVGGLSFDFNAATGAVTGYVQHASGALIPIGSVLASGWTFVYIRKTANMAMFGYGTAATSATETTVDDTFEVEGLDDTISIEAGNGSFQLHDLRLWNVFKTEDEMDFVRDYSPTPTVVNYRLSWIYSVNRSDRYGLKVMGNGFVQPADLPSSLRNHRQQLVRRYNSTGSYVGETRQKETGLGGSVLAPQAFGQTSYPLGYVLPFDESNGTFIVAGTNGQLPGVNSKWFNDQIYPNYIVLSGGSTSSGSLASTAVEPSLYWPGEQVMTNPCRDVIWVKGDNGYVYEVKLAGNVSSTELFGVMTGDVYVGSTAFAEQRTGAEVRLTDGGKGLHVASTGTTYQGTVSGTESTPPLWMYLYERTIEDVANAWDRWVSGGIFFDDTAFGNDLAAHPEVSQPVAALNDNGFLEFQNTSLLTPGRYRIWIESGNIGKVDADFDGFVVEISINNTVIPVRLLRGKSGYNIRGVEMFEFELPSTTTGPWLLTLTWTNAFSDPSKGVKRQLVVYSYRLTRRATELWKVEVGVGNLVYSNVTPHAGTYDATVGGGWLQSITSDGSIYGQTHESLVYPQNDTGTSKLPLSDMLTGSTNNRREDVIVMSVSGNIVGTDAPGLVLPSFGSLVVVDAPAANVPLWLWSGGITDATAIVSAKMPVDSTVRLAVSTSSDMSAPVYTDYAEASAALNNRVARMTISGLTAWTHYYYAVETDGVLATGKIGEFTTFGTTANVFSFALAGDSNNVRGTAVNSVIFDTIRGINPLFFFNLGDLHYNDISTNSVNRFRDALDAIFVSSGSYTFLTSPASNVGSSRQEAMFRAMPVVWVWDDHDFGANDSDSTSASRQAARSVYREYVPHYPLQSGGPDAAINYSFRVGRCVFIVTDNRSEKSDRFATDNSAKRVFSAAQEAWWKQQVLQASSDPEIQFIFWINSFCWISAPAVSDDNWGGYTSHRQELATWLFDNSVTRLFLLSADMHACAIDDGRHADYAIGSSGTNGYPVFQLAPLQQTSSNKGGPYLIGPTPAGGIANTQQYGVVTVYDYGTTSYLNVTGYNNVGTVLTATGTNMTITLWGTQSPYP